MFILLIALEIKLLGIRAVGLNKNVSVLGRKRKQKRLQEM
jgi:hypothetical protein